VNNSWMGPVTDDRGDDRRSYNSGGVAITRIVRLTPQWAELALGGADATLHCSALEVADDGYGACRRLRGTLRSRRGWFRLPVELQLSSWSASATELTLRPRRRGHRPGRGRWYLAAGTALMDMVSGDDG